MDFDLEAVANGMLSAMSTSLGNSWDKVSDYAEGEAKKLAQSAADLARLRIAGKVSEEQAKLLLGLQANAAKLVFLAIEGMGILAVEAAINAALAVLREAVNRAAGIAVF